MTIRCNKFIDRLLTVWTITGIAILLTISFMYLRAPVLLDHAGEVTISTVSWLLYNGSPLYTTLDATERYSLQHGPIIYLLVGGIMKLLGPSIFTAKLLPFLSLLVIMSISWKWFKHFFENKMSLWLLGLEVWLILKYYYLYLVRDDVVMFLCTLISVYFATTKHRRSIIILGVAFSLGILVNLKIHGILYAIPILILVKERFSTTDLLLSIGSLACIFMLPFMLPNISLVNYMQWVTLSTQHGFSMKILQGNLFMAVLFLMLPLTVGAHFKCDLIKIFKENKFFISTLGLTLLIAAVIGSKRGSGSHHLAPFIPMIMYVIVLVVKYSGTNKIQLLVSPRRSFMRGVGCVVGISIFITLIFNGVNSQGRIIRYTKENKIEQVKLEEVHYIQEKYRGHSMAIGYGEEKTYRFYDQLIPMMIFAGNPYLLDVSALNDMAVIGLPIPETTLKSLSEGSTEIWLLPKGDSPFSLQEGYDGRALFSDAFRQTFFEKYTIIEKTRYFDIWGYHGNQP